MDKLTDDQVTELQEIQHTLNANKKRISDLQDAQRYAAMANNAHHNQDNMLGGAGLGGLGQPGGYGIGQAGWHGHPSSIYQTAAKPSDSKEDMLRDLMRRIARRASVVKGEPLVATISEHSAIVERMLRDFLEGSSYIQAQVPMVQAAFKTNESLANALTQALNRAYTELCAQYFGEV